MAETSFLIGNSSIVPPDGWRFVSQEDDRLVFRTDKQQATIGLVRFDKEVTSEEFKILCDIRVKGEKKFLKDGYVELEPQFRDRDILGSFFYGADKSSGRVFFGYLCSASKEVVTMYVEGIGVDPVAHGADFRAFVKALRT